MDINLSSTLMFMHVMIGPCIRKQIPEYWCVAGQVYRLLVHVGHVWAHWAARECTVEGWVCQRCLYGVRSRVLNSGFIFYCFIFYWSCVEIIWEYMYMHRKLGAVQLHVAVCVHALSKTAIFHALHTNTSMTSWRKVEKCRIGTRVLAMVVEAATRAAACWDKPATTCEYSSTPPEQLVKHGDFSPLTAPCKFNVDVCWG